MTDPLTRTRHGEFLKRFEEAYFEAYDQALKSGAVEDLPPDDHTLVKCVLVIAAEKFKPISDTGKAMLANLVHFI
jgi:hypothetical protein